MFGALPPSSERQPLLRPGERALDPLADFRRSGEGDLVDVGVLDESAAPVAPAPVMMLTTPGGRSGFLDDLREHQRGERRRLGGLEHDRVAGRQRRRDLPGRHQQREVPRDDLPGHAERRHGAIRETRIRACPPSPRSRKKCAAASGMSMSRDSLIGLPPFIVSTTASTRDFSWISRAMRKMYFARSLGAILRHTFLVRAPRLTHRAIHILRIRLGDLRQRLFRRRIDRLEPPLRMRLDELAADEEVVPRRDLDVVGRLERGSVLPEDRGARGAGGEAFLGFESCCH